MTVPSILVGCTLDKSPHAAWHARRQGGEAMLCIYPQARFRTTSKVLWAETPEDRDHGLGRVSHSLLLEISIFVMGAQDFMTTFWGDTDF